MKEDIKKCNMGNVGCIVFGASPTLVTKSQDYFLRCFDFNYSF